MSLLPITEQPWAVDSNLNFVVGDHTKRSTWQNSFFMPSDQHVGYALTVSAGAVQSNSGATVVLSILAGTPYDLTTTGVLQVYIGDSGSGANVFCVPSAITTPFPSNSLPVAMMVLDGVGRMQQLIDSRPSNLSSAPDLGSGMKESVADITKRVYLQNNYYVPRTSALTAQIPQDWSLPASGFLVGSGSVSLSGNVVSTATTYLSTAAKGGQLAVNAINQGYIDPGTGLLAIRQVQTSGVFPANSLALFEATTDSVGLIRSLVDFRPSYI